MVEHCVGFAGRLELHLAVAAQSALSGDSRGKDRCLYHQRGSSKHTFFVSVPNPFNELSESHWTSLSRRSTIRMRKHDAPLET